MNMEKRAVIAVVVSMLIILAFPSLLGKFFPQANRLNPPQPISQNEILPMETTKEKDAGILPSKGLFSEDKEISLETDNYKVVFSDIGGTVKSIVLKKYLDSATKEPMLLAEAPYPADAIFSLVGLDPEIDKGLVFSRLRKQDSIIFSADTPSGLSVIKEIKFVPGKYALELKQTITNNSTQSKTLRYAVVGGCGVTKLSIQDELYLEIIRNVDGKILNANKRSIKPGLVWNGGKVTWAALKNRYFSLILKVPDNFTNIYPNLLENKELEVKISSGGFTLNPKSSLTQNFVLYAGPNDLDKMRSLGLGFEDSMHLGMTGGIGRLLFAALGFFEKLTGNWGIAIILLTISINVLLFPLTFKSLKSMRQMQAIQPKIEALRSAHKDNPQKLNKEIIELYKKYKINPMGGCLPMLLQMPVFFALYQILMTSIGLRSAAFLWIKDLSHPDRFILLNFSIPWFGNELNILPILMAIAMFFQQKVSAPNPSSGQLAQQQRMMTLMMPIVFGALFYRLPSGLVLYWLTNTIVTITEQELFVKKHLFHVEQS